MEKEKTKLLKPKIDVVFHALFRKENNRLTEALISDIVGEKVKIIANMDRYLNIKDANEKLGVMDLRVELSNRIKCNLEIQINKYKNEIDRFMYYLANIYSSQLARSEDYTEIQKCISIVILDHEIDILKGFERLNVKWHMRDDETGKRILTNNLELIIIELPKARRLYSKKSDDKLYQWMLFLDDPNTKEVSNIMDKNEIIKDAKNELETVSGDYEIRRIAELREKAIRDEKAALAYAKEEGLEKGIKEGKKEGIKEGTKMVAYNMLKKGFDISIISEITGLSEKEIINLKK